MIDLFVEFIAQSFLLNLIKGISLGFSGYLDFLGVWIFWVMDKKKAAAPLVCHGHSRPVVDLFYSPVTPDGYFLISASKGKKKFLWKVSVYTVLIVTYVLMNCPFIYSLC